MSQMKKEDARQKLVNIFSRILNVKAEDVKEDFSQEDRSEWDSLNNLLLLTEVEKEFGISIPLTDVPRITTFKKMEEEISKLI